MEKEIKEEIIEPKKHHILKKIGIGFILILILLFIYAFKLTHLFLITEEYPVINETLPSNFNGFKIAHFSDIHFGKTIHDTELDNVIDKLNQTNSDIVVYTGDLFDNGINLSDKNIDYLKNSLKKINAKLKKYAIKGDNDFKNETLYQEIMESAGFIMLDNKSELIFYEGTIPIQIGGVSSIQKKEMNISETFKTTETNIAYKILIAHEPDTIKNIGDEKIDVMLAGHSLGGVINIPFVGEIFKKSNTSNYQKGIYNLDNKKIIVSSGIGCEEYSFRFGNPPSINFYRLYNYE